LNKPARYLLDTNILSETRKSRPNEGVISFIEAAKTSDLFLSALTIGELAKGVEMKGRTDPILAAQIGTWLSGIEQMFADRVLPVDALVARQWGELSADRSRPVIDTLIAATAVAHGLTLVTRNEVYIRGIELAVVNPWKPAA